MDTTILILSDLHDGGIDSIRMDPDNELQRLLKRKYVEIIRAVRPKIVIMLGDMVNGTNRKPEGLGNWTCDMMQQIDDAERLIRMTKAKTYYGVTGTHYHTGANPNADAILYENLEAEYAVNREFIIDGVSFYCSHYISGAGCITGGTGLGTQLAKGEIHKNRVGDFKVQLHGHSHEFAFQGKAGHLAVRCPCWKGRDDHAASKGLTYMPDLGAVWFKTHGDGEYSWGHMVFDLPPHLIIPRTRYIGVKA